MYRVAISLKNGQMLEGKNFNTREEAEDYILKEGKQC